MDPMGRAFVRIAPGVLVCTSRQFATTSTIILGRDHGALIVDPAWEADELAGVADLLTQQGVTSGAGLATHLHYDHVLWHPEFPKGPRWATTYAAHAWRHDRERLVSPLLQSLPEELIPWAGILDALPSGTTSKPLHLPWPARDVIVHEHDAHARGHLAVELPDAGLLLAGDMLSDVELPMPADDETDLTTYLAALDQLEPVVRRAQVLVPGHGSPSEHPMERLDADRRYLEALLCEREPDDDRIHFPGMAELHASNVRRARLTSSR